MNVEQFDFDLPDDLIAQTPLKERSESRLLTLDYANQRIEHRQFFHIQNYLKAGDALVLNNTKVIPARLFGMKETGAAIEILLLEDIGEDTWKALVKPAKRIKIGDKILFGEGLLTAECVAVQDEGIRQLKLQYDGILQNILDKLGTMPLPPYIKETLDDASRYQTVYAKTPGSAAAPTAGLHFTTELLEQLTAQGVDIYYVTLHVGLGTFRPVSVDNVDDHTMHSEYYEIDEVTAKALNDKKRAGKRIISVGTTSTRTLETVYSMYNEFRASSGYTDIFIYPGYEYKAIDGLITNFHLPKSTLMMLVSALAGRELIMKAYSEAIQERYRFFSFGDAMFIYKGEQHGGNNV